MLHDPEEEHDCFSDNPHYSHYYDQLGIMNVYLGRYERVDGSVVKRPSLSDLVAAEDAAVDTEMKASLEGAFTALPAMADPPHTVKVQDTLMSAGKAEGSDVVAEVGQTLLHQKIHTKHVDGRGHIPA